MLACLFVVLLTTTSDHGQLFTMKHDLHTMRDEIDLSDINSNEKNKRNTQIHVHTVHNIKMVCELQISHIGT